MSTVFICRPCTVVLGCILLLASLVLVAGCGSGNHATVSGTVHFDSKPVPSGTIRFLAQDEGKNHTNGTIHDGKYELTERGPMPGTYKVQISWPKKTGRKINLSEIGDPEYAQDETIEQIPAKYNSSKTTLEVVIQSGPNTHNFDLKR